MKFFHIHYKIQHTRDTTDFMVMHRSEHVNKRIWTIDTPLPKGNSEVMHTPCAAGLLISAPLLSVLLQDLQGQVQRTEGVRHALENKSEGEVGCQRYICLASFFANTAFTTFWLTF